MEPLENRIRRLLRHNPGFIADSPLRFRPWSQHDNWTRLLVRSTQQPYLVTLYDQAADFSKQQKITAWLQDGHISSLLPGIEVHAADKAVVLGPLPGEPVAWARTLELMAANSNLAVSLGQRLGRVHQVALDPEKVPEVLSDGANFRTARIYPEFQVTARAHPDIATVIEAIVREITDLHLALTLGGPAQEIVLFTEQTPVCYGFEFAHIGDPAVDVSTLLAALLVRACASVQHTGAYVSAAESLWRGYVSTVGSEFGHSGMPQGSLEARVCRQVGVLMLSTVDGLKPSLASEPTPWQDAIRTAGRNLVMRPLGRLDGVLTRVHNVAQHNVSQQSL